MHSRKVNPMRFLLMMVVLCVVFAGCADQGESTATVPTEEEAHVADNSIRYLAYEHTIQLDVAEDRVEAIHRSVVEKCKEATEDHCVVLESSLHTGRYASANIRLRAKPDGIKKLIAAIGAEGNVISQSVTAEDLASPIADTDKRLEMLNDYRTRLESLRDKAGEDIDALIKVNKELAEVQSTIESLTGNRTYLLQRVETEILTVTISSLAGGSFWRPIGLAVQEFTDNLSESISGVVTASAFMLPWIVVFYIVGWIVRKLWSRRKKAKAWA